MTAEYIRSYYRVPAKRGMRIKFRGEPGTIVGFAGQYLRVRLDGERDIKTCHPTWEIEYPRCGCRLPTEPLVDGYRCGCNRCWARNPGGAWQVGR